MLSLQFRCGTNHVELSRPEQTERRLYLQIAITLDDWRQGEINNRFPT